MPKSDYGHQLTDRELEALERKITRVYQTAANEMQPKIDAYFESFRERDKEQKARLDKGEITRDYYNQWRLNQIGRGQRMEALRDQLAERYTQANEVTAYYINDTTPGIYALNRNYSAYTIERVSGSGGFTLMDEQTVRRLSVESPDLMPHYPADRAVQRGIDLAYGKRQITQQVTSGILQGESIKHLADRLQSNIPTMQRNSAIRAARTAVTGAQNAGRLDSFEAAEEMGITVQKQWLATLDGRTRHSHAELDGEIVDTSEKFSNGCMYPGDPTGEPSEIYNCRCTMIAALPDVKADGVKRIARDPVSGRNELIDDMTYEEWENSKRSIAKSEKSATMEMKRTYAQQEGYAVDIPEQYLGNFDDYEALTLDDREKSSLKELNALSIRDGVEYGAAYVNGEVSKVFTSNEHNRVHIPLEIEQVSGTRLLHSHTNCTTLSAPDLKLLTNPNVDAISVITINGDVFTAEVGYGEKASKADYEQAASRIEHEVDMDMIASPDFFDWTIEQRNYMAIREQMYRLAREFGWTLKGGRI